MTMCDTSNYVAYSTFDKKVIEKSKKSIQVFSDISFNREKFTENKYLSDRI